MLATPTTKSDANPTLSTASRLLLPVLWLSAASGRSRRGPALRIAVASTLSSNAGCSSTSSAMAQLKGTLFRYGSSPVQVAFRSGDFKAQVIFLGGLTDGLLATDYIEPLAKALEVEQWSLVQPLLSSSYTGFGTSSLKQIIQHSVGCYGARSTRNLFD